jgi:uncharacterized repeat protein (TIGR03803 family)
MKECAMRVWKSSLATLSPTGFTRRHLPYAVAVLVFSMAAVVSSAQTYTVLYNFQGFPGGGGNPLTAMFQATDGNLYGTTSSGGMLNADGTLFKTTPSGKLTTLYDFCNSLPCTDGDVPDSLLQAVDGNIYGLTTYGGVGKCACGTFFQLTSSGITTLASFKQVSGADPKGQMVQATDGNFYGTTAALGRDYYGTVFKVTSSGALTAIHTFCMESNCPDGAEPYGGLLQATNQMLYGTRPAAGRTLVAQCSKSPLGENSPPCTIFAPRAGFARMATTPQPRSCRETTGTCTGQPYTGAIAPAKAVVAPSSRLA